VSKKVRAARISVASNLALVIGKLSVGLSIGSVSVVSEAIHSAVDAVASLIALFSLKVADQPADNDHSYGHGKVENLSALVEGILVLAAAAWVIREAFLVLMVGASAPVVTAGLWIMGINAVVTWFVSGYLFKVAREEESVALAADALNTRADVWTSIAVFTGLLLVKWTGIAWLDPLAALAVAAMIIKAGWSLCAQALMPLIDARLPQEEEDEIIGMIEKHGSDFLEFHDLRTRRAGSERHVDFHLVVHGNRSLEEVHRLCDQIETAIGERFPRAHTLIHPEPCTDHCDYCQGKRLRRIGSVASGPGRRIKTRGVSMRRRTDHEFAD